MLSAKCFQLIEKYLESEEFVPAWFVLWREMKDKSVCNLFGLCARVLSQTCCGCYKFGSAKIFCLRTAEKTHSKTTTPGSKEFCKCHVLIKKTQKARVFWGWYENVLSKNKSFPKQTKSQTTPPGLFATAFSLINIRSLLMRRSTENWDRKKDFNAISSDKLLRLMGVVRINEFVYFYSEEKQEQQQQPEQTDNLKDQDSDLATWLLIKLNHSNQHLTAPLSMICFYYSII